MLRRCCSLVPGAEIVSLPLTPTSGTAASFRGGQFCYSFTRQGQGAALFSCRLNCKPVVSRVPISITYK
jgi:hypothetical protein